MFVTSFDTGDYLILLTFHMLRSLRYSGRTSLFLGTALGALALSTQARADDDIVSKMEQEMSRLQAAQAHVQEEQRAINHDMAILKAEIARHHASGTSPIHANSPHAEQIATQENHSENITTASIRRHGNKTTESPETISAERGMTTTSASAPLHGAHTRRDRVSLSPTGRDLIDTDKGSELAVVGHRAEDVLVHFA